MNKKLQILSDRSEGIMEIVNDLVESWSYDLSKRKPGIAYVDDKGNPITNLDAACFMSYLADKRGVINVSTYKGMRARQHTEGEVVVSSANRHGKLNYLTSNQKVWSFGFNFRDFNVITADTVGKDRSFAMQGMDGEWYEGWDVIELLPTGLAAEVMEALTDDNNKAHFGYFIHPLRWVSIFGESFRVAKFAADYRIPDRLRFLKAELKRLREALEIEPKEWPWSEKDPSQPKKFWAYESFIDGVTLTGEYGAFPTTQEGYEEAGGEKRRLEALQRTLRFHVRASEFAWWQHLTKDFYLYDVDYSGQILLDDDGNSILSNEPIEWVVHGGKEISKPVWAKDKTWQHGVTDPLKPKGRTLFVAMEMEEGLSYRFRVMHKTEQVAVD